MIDIHCHLLPGVDDGPATLEDALALAAACVDDGITHVVASPHVFPGRWDNRRGGIEEHAQRFQTALQGAGIALTLGWAGEVRLAPESLDLLAGGELPMLGQVGGYRTLLLEMPDGQIPLGSERFVKACLKVRVRPVIVHPERNRAVMELPQRLRPLVDLGCFVQLTAGSLVGQFGALAQVTARRLLDWGWVHALASDAHNLRGRAPRMRDAAAWLEQHLGAQRARELTLLGPAGLCGRPEWAGAAHAGHQRAA